MAWPPSECFGKLTTAWRTRSVASRWAAASGSLAIERRHELEDEGHVGLVDRRALDHVPHLDLVGLADQLEERGDDGERPSIDIGGEVGRVGCESHPGQAQRVEPAAEVEDACRNAGDCPDAAVEGVERIEPLPGGCVRPERMRAGGAEGRRSEIAGPGRRDGVGPGGAAECADGLVEPPLHALDGIVGVSRPSELLLGEAREQRTIDVPIAG